MPSACIEAAPPCTLVGDEHGHTVVACGDDLRFVDPQQRLEGQRLQNKVRLKGDARFVARSCWNRPCMQRSQQSAKAKAVCSACLESRLRQRPSALHEGQMRMQEGRAVFTGCGRIPAHR